MQIRFWGTRGSLAKPGSSTLRYGGNTSCVEVRTDDGTVIVLDCGTGAHGLGQALVGSGAAPVRGHLLITHTHWDHIQGFPFFEPLFADGNEWDVYAPGGLGQRLEATLAGQMQYTYFPVTLDQLGATMRCHDLVEGELDLGGARVIAQYLNHPALTLGYRIEAGGVSVVYATDHEPHSRHQAEPATSIGMGATTPIHTGDQRHLDFLEGADLVIHDAQYTAAEYAQKIGWGHSTMEYAVDMTLAAHSKRLALFHHDPLREDATLDRLESVYRERAERTSTSLKVFFAREGQIIDLREGLGTTPEVGTSGMFAAVNDAVALPRLQTVLLADDDEDVLRLLTDTLRPEGFRLLVATNGLEALDIALRERPELLLLDWHMPGMNGPDVCRRLRSESDPQLREAPIVLITTQAGPEHIAEGFAAGITDYLAKPFTPAHVRTRIRGWLLRAIPGIVDSAARS